MLNTNKALGSNPESSDSVKEVERVHPFAEPGCTRLCSSRHGPDLCCGYGTNSCGSDRRAFRASEHQFLASALYDPANLHAYRTQQTFGVGLAQHGQVHGQPISASRCHARGYSFDLGMHPNQQQRIRKRGPIAIRGLHGMREPGEFAAGAAGSPLPPALAPVETQAGERGVVLAGAVGAAGAEFGHMDLVDLVEPTTGVRRKYIGQAGHHSGSHHESSIVTPCQIIEFEKIADFSEAVANRDHVNSPGERRLGARGVRAHPTREDDNRISSDALRVEGLPDFEHAIAMHIGNGSGYAWRVVEQREVCVVVEMKQVSRKTSTSSTDTHDDVVAH